MNPEEPTKRELEEIDKMIEKGFIFDEEFDDFQIMEEDFNVDEDNYGEDW